MRSYIYICTIYCVFSSTYLIVAFLYALNVPILTSSRQKLGNFRTFFEMLCGGKAYVKHGGTVGTLRIEDIHSLVFVLIPSGALTTACRGKAASGRD